MTSEKKSLKLRKKKRLNSCVFRLIISYLNFEKNLLFDKNIPRKKDIRPDLEILKNNVLDSILLRQKSKGLQYYTVAWETHSSNLLPHLDILLVYQKTLKKSYSSFDYLLPLCPQDITLVPVPYVNITSYSKTQLNLAILEYGQKEDPIPLSNINETMSLKLLRLNEIKKDPYSYLQDRMKEDPYNFHIDDYIEQHDLARHIPNWRCIKSKLNDIQQARIGRLQLLKPGIKYISRSLIQKRLSSQELITFDTYPCFQIIVDHLNQIPSYGFNRPHKTMNLLITGPKNIGKTSLLEGHPNSLDRYVGSYSVKLENKYLNSYKNNKYGFINWNEFKYSDFSPTWVLQFLEGCKVTIPMRWNACIKKDNPLIIMTSNLSLDEHISNRFSNNPRFLQIARDNLNVRITNVHVPVPMYFMQKLLVSNDIPDTEI
jgi:hypothetical protein